MNPIYPDLKNKHILITGGSNGIGEALTRSFAAQANEVTILDQDYNKGLVVAKECENYSCKVNCLEKPSPFLLGFEIQDNFLEELEKYSFDKIFFFPEPYLFKLYGKDLFNKISEKYHCQIKFLPIGEKCKHFPVLEETCENLIVKGVSKNSIKYDRTN